MAASPEMEVIPYCLIPEISEGLKFSIPPIVHPAKAAEGMEERQSEINPEYAGDASPEKKSGVIPEHPPPSPALNLEIWGAVNPAAESAGICAIAWGPIPEHAPVSKLKIPSLVTPVQEVEGIAARQAPENPE